MPTNNLCSHCGNSLTGAKQKRYCDVCKPERRKAQSRKRYRRKIDHVLEERKLAPAQ